MRILLYTVINMNGSFGSRVNMERFANKLNDRGHDIILFAPLNKGKKRHFNFPVVYLKPKGDSQIIVKLIQDISAILNLLNIIKNQWKPDIVFSRFGISTFLLPIACKLLKIPYITEVHGYYEQILQSRRIPKFLRPVFLSAERLNYILSTKIVAVSDVLARLVRDIRGIDKNKVIIIPNSVDLKDYCIKTPSDDIFKQSIRGTANLVLGFVGGFEKFLGLEYLIEAVAMLKRKNPCIAHEVKVILIGDGKGRQAIRELIDKHDLGNNIKLTGWVNHEDIPKYLSCIDVGLAPYLPDSSPKGCSLKVLEYLAAGKWVIASEMPVVSKIIRETNAGYILENCKPETILEAIMFSWRHRTALSLNADKAREYIGNHLNWDIRLKKIEDIMQESLTGVSNY